MSRSRGAPGAVPVRRGAARRRLVLGAGASALLVALALGVTVGSRTLPLDAVLEVLAGRGTSEARAILVEQRIPRSVLALVGGAALAVAGVVIQAHTRNPLADPGLIGVTAGASLAVVVAIALLGVTRPDGYVWFALAGAAGATAVVTALARLAGGRRDSSPATLVLAGSAVTAVLGAASGLVLLLSSSTLDLFRFFAVGSLSGTHDLPALAPAFVCVAAGLLLAALGSPVLDALALGDDTARSLGRDLARSRLTGLATVTLLVAGGVMCCGSLGFVGLVVPHLARLLVGPAHRSLLPAGALLGAVAVLLADVAGRVLVRPAELPVGVVVAMAGAPLFLVVVVRLRGGRS